MKTFICIDHLRCCSPSIVTVVLAPSKEEAQNRLDAELKRCGISGIFDLIEIESRYLHDEAKSKVFILFEE